MKITTGEMSPLQPEGQKNHQKASPGGFQEILNEKIGQTSADVQKPAVVPPMSNIDSIRFDAGAVPDRKQILAAMDGFLALLETYQKQMGDPLVSLKETAGVVSRMELKVRELHEVWEALPDGDGIKDLLNRMLVASSVEAIKFNRGDYL
jgi:hypothetical protein